MRRAMALVGTLLARLMAGRMGLQEAPDVWKLYHLVHYFQQCGGTEVRVTRPEKVSSRKQYSAVHAAVTEQVVRLLMSLQQTTAEPAPRGEMAPEDSQARQSGSSLLRVDGLPFHFSVPEPPCTTHPIPGVHLHGHAVPGSVLCFFPGTVYLPPHVDQLPDYPDITSHNPHLMSRTDGSIIDAKDYRMPEADQHPLALGHLVLHPPKGKQPNVMPFSYNVPLTFPPDLLPLIPNRYHKQPNFLYSRNTSLRSLVFISMVHIRDEELFLNYRLNPGSNLPDWYCSVDPAEDQQRWRYF